MTHVPAILADGGLWPTVSLVIFFLLFLSIVAYVMIVPKAKWQKDAEIPLENPTQTGMKEQSRG